MPDNWEEQKRQAQSAFMDKWTQDYMMHGSPPEQAIRQAAQNAHEDIEKLTKRFFLQEQDEIKIKRQEVKEDINRSLGDEVFSITHLGHLLETGEIRGEPASFQQIMEEMEETKREIEYGNETQRDIASYHQEYKAAWRKEVWENPYKPPYLNKPYYADLDEINSIVGYNDFLSRESRRIRQILENNGLTREDIEHQNRIMDRESDIEPEI